MDCTEYTNGSATRWARTAFGEPAASRGGGASGRPAAGHGRRSDPDLIRACLDGDQKAWDRLVEQYGGLVYSIPRAYGLAEPDSEDVFQNVFVALFRHLARLKDQTRLSAWLITTTRRECWRVWSQGDGQLRTNRHVEDVAHDDANDADDADRPERRALIREAIDRLGQRDRELLLSLFRVGASTRYDRLARQLDMCVGSIGPTRARCLEKLRLILVDMGAAPALQPRCATA